MKTSSVVLSCLLLAGACSKAKELDDRTQNMEKATESVSVTTVEMKEITREMKQTTEEMKEITSEMKDTTTTMYLQIRSKEAEDTRDKKFNILMNDAADAGTRVAAAAVYFKSMEFQLWNDNESYDNKSARDVLYTDAANEFTRRMCDLYEKINTKKMSPTKDNKMEMSFYAIAAALHMNHSYQEETSKSKKTETISMYDLIENGLAKDAKGLPLMEHEEILMNGINKEIMVELFKARVDMLSALALKNLTDKRDMTLGQKAKGLLFKITGGLLGSIDLPEVYDLSNEATKSQTEKYLDGAVGTKDFLKQIKIEKPLEKTLKSAFKNIDFNEKNKNENEKGTDHRKETIRGMINTLIK